MGAQERDSQTVNIRNRDDPKTQAKGELIPLNDAIEKLVELRDQRRLVNAIDVTTSVGSNAANGDSENALLKARIVELEEELKKAKLE